MITIIQNIGYYHPSNANWSYRIHGIIDKTGARLYRETFGDDNIMMQRLEAKGKAFNRLYFGKGSGVEYKWQDIKDLPDIKYYAGKNW